MGRPLVGSQQGTSRPVPGDTDHHPTPETQACGQQGRRGGPASTGLTSHSGRVEKLPPKPGPAAVSLSSSCVTLSFKKQTHLLTHPFVWFHRCSDFCFAFRFVEASVLISEMFPCKKCF